MTIINQSVTMVASPVGAVVALILGLLFLPSIITAVAVISVALATALVIISIAAGAGIVIMCGTITYTVVKRLQLEQKQFDTFQEFAQDTKRLRELKESPIKVDSTRVGQTNGNYESCAH